MTPSRIPTITGRPGLHNRYEVALCSPSVKHPDIYRGTRRTIVDCHMYYLRMRPRLMRQHLLWYIDKVRQHATEQDLVFVAPDIVPRYGQDLVQEILDAWTDIPNEAQVLVVPGTQICTVVTQRIVGHALPSSVKGPAHPEWTHSFSRNYNQLEQPTKLWTYDSL